MTSYWHYDLTQIAGGVLDPTGGGFVSAPTYATGFATGQSLVAGGGQTARVLYVNDSGSGGDVHVIQYQGNKVQSGSWLHDLDLSERVNPSDPVQGYSVAFGYSYGPLFDDVARICL